MLKAFWVSLMRLFASLGSWMRLWSLAVLGCVAWTGFGFLRCVCGGTDLVDSLGRSPLIWEIF